MRWVGWGRVRAGAGGWVRRRFGAICSAGNGVRGNFGGGVGGGAVCSARNGAIGGFNGGAVRCVGNGVRGGVGDGVGNGAGGACGNAASAASAVRSAVLLGPDTSVLSGAASGHARPIWARQLRDRDDPSRASNINI